MKKLIMLITLLLVTSVCFAEPLTMITDNSGSPITPSQIGSGFGYAQTDVGLSAVSLGSTSAITRIILKPAVNNLGMIYIGDSSVSVGNGLEVASGSITSLDITTVNGLYAVASRANQKLSIFIIKK